MKGVTRTFLMGLATTLPIAVTLYVLVWLSTTAESGLGKGIRLFLPDRLYSPGMGLAAGVAVVFLVGILMRAWIIRKVFGWAEALLYHLPLVRTVYRSIKDFLYYFSQLKKENSRQVVMVALGNTGIEIMGFITRHDLRDLPSGIESRGTVAVYVPLSFQLGGLTLLLPRSAVRPVNMSMEEAMRFILTAGMTAKHPAFTPSSGRSSDG